jgi:hypothetical protein
MMRPEPQGEVNGRISLEARDGLKKAENGRKEIPILLF